MAEYKEIEQTREVLEEVSGEDIQHQKFEDGFTIRTIIGALFVGFIMMPGAMYLGLVAGQGLGPAAQWVTIVLFAEVAKRSFQPLKKQELYLLFWVAGGISGVLLADRGLSGGPFAGLIWNQYLVQSPQIGTLAKEIPTWVVPKANDPALANRTFFSMSWLIPIVLVVVNEIIGRMIWIGGGYAVFRITSDVERLPFPYASIAAAGATALAESGSKEDSWRWQVFSIGSVVGLLFGLVYLFIPIVTGALFGKPVQLIPIPFIDFTANTESFLPAAVSGLSGDLGIVMFGMVVPFPVVLGTFLSSIICQVFMNPILYNAGLIPDWTPGTPLIQTQMSADVDFFFFLKDGIGVDIVVICFYTVTRTALRMRNEARDRTTIRRLTPPGRGDWNIYLSIGIWFVATVVQIGITMALVPGFPWWILVFYGLVYTPIISYVSGRLVGLTGNAVGFPYLREATIMKSGYTGMDIWFAGIPMHDLGHFGQKFREVELTGTKFTSVIKVEILMMAIVLPASFLFWSFFWKTSPIPSPQYPNAQKMWPYLATMQSIWWTANKSGERNWLLAALKPNLMFGSGILTILLYMLATFFKVPLMFFYGFASGVGQMPYFTIPYFAGGALGRWYFRKRFGDVRWSQYVPVLVAGFGCGTGLTAMTGIALALITKSVNFLPF